MHSNSSYVLYLDIPFSNLFSLMPLVFTVTIAVGVQDRPASALQSGVWVSNYKIIGDPSFTEAISAVSSLIFAFAGTPAFFNIVSEMRDPRLYTRSLLICQSGVTGTYIAIGTVVYYFCGSYVASPALGSAGPTMKKVSYGLALPGLLVTTILVIHVRHSFYPRLLDSYDFSFTSLIPRMLVARQDPVHPLFTRVQAPYF